MRYKMKVRNLVNESNKTISIDDIFDSNRGIPEPDEQYVYAGKEKEKYKQASYEDIGRVIARSPSVVMNIVNDALSFFIKLFMTNPKFNEKFLSYVYDKIENSDIYNKIGANLDDEVVKVTKELLNDYDGIRALFLVGVFSDVNIWKIIEETVFKYIKEYYNEKMQDFDELSDELGGVIYANYDEKQASARIARWLENEVRRQVKAIGPSPTDCDYFRMMFILALCKSANNISYSSYVYIRDLLKSGINKTKVFGERVKKLIRQVVSAAMQSGNNDIIDTIILELKRNV